MQLTTFFAIALSLASVAESATIVPRARNVVWSPTILSAHASSIWKSDTRLNVLLFPGFRGISDGCYRSTANTPAVISNLGKVVLHGGPAYVPFVSSSCNYTITRKFSMGSIVFVVILVLISSLRCQC